MKLWIVVLALMLSSVVVAEDDLPGNWISPGNIFHGLDRAWDALMIKAAMGAESEAVKRIEVAEERMMEMVMTSAVDNEEGYDKAEELYLEQMDQIKELKGDMNYEEFDRVQNRLEQHERVLNRIQTEGRSMLAQIEVSTGKARGVWAK